MHGIIESGVIGAGSYASPCDRSAVTTRHGGSEAACRSRDFLKKLGGGECEVNLECSMNLVKGGRIFEMSREMGGLC